MQRIDSGRMVVGIDGQFFDGDCTLPQIDEVTLVRMRYNELMTAQLVRNAQQRQVKAPWWQKLLLTLWGSRQ